MLKKKITFLLVPPKNERIRYFRIRFGVILFFLLFIVCGYAGFFIPFNALTLDVVELNQKRHLTKQNRGLLDKVRTMREMFFTLRGKLEALNRIKIDISGLIEMDNFRKGGAGSTGADRIRGMSLDKKLAHVDVTDSFMNAFAEKVKNNPAYIDYIPVLKPVFDKNVITASFGIRNDPFTGDKKWHNGVDFSAERETPVFATASGTVDLVENHNHWGRRVRIQHRFGFSTAYAHLGTVSVLTGQNVKRGDVIATIGLSGLTTGPHLHYEIHHRSKNVDPELYFFPEKLYASSR